MRVEFENRPIAGVLEKQIDVILVEELTVNPAFSEWIFKRCDIEGQPIQVRNSVWHDGKEIDVLCVTKFPKIGVMIENKITAPLPSQQVQNYHDVGRGQVKQGFWTDYRVLVLAPRSWIEHHQPENVHAVISYEDIATFLRTHNDPRLDWRASVFQQAARRHRTARRNSGNNLSQKDRGRDGLRTAAIVEALALMKSPSPPSGRKGAFSLKDVARAIGTSPATVHDLFGSFDGLMANVQMSVYQDMTRTILESAFSPEGRNPTAVLAEVFSDSAELIYLSSRNAGLQNDDRLLVESAQIDLKDAVCACIRAFFPQLDNDVGNHVTIALLGASQLAANDAHGLDMECRIDMENMVLQAIRAGYK